MGNLVVGRRIAIESEVFGGGGGLVTLPQLWQHLRRHDGDAGKQKSMSLREGVPNSVALQAWWSTSSSSQWFSALCAGPVGRSLYRSVSTPP